MPNLWIDTNAARSAPELEKLSRLAQPKGVDVVIHPQVYLERRRQQQAHLGARFSEKIFDKFLQRCNIRVVPFFLDQATSASWADELHRRYPTDEEWEAAKKRTIGGSLKPGFAVMPGWMPMTTDWFISLVVEGDAGSRVITDDDGEEWRMLRLAAPPRALGWEEALAWLDSLPPLHCS